MPYCIFYTPKLNNIASYSQSGRIKRLLPAIVWAIIIFVLSIISGNRLPKIDLGWIQPDKVGHFGVYFIFSVLLYYGLSPLFSKEKKVALLAIIISALYGIAMEIIQFLFFPGRFFEYLDIIANISGSIGSLIVINYFFKAGSEKRMSN